MLLDAQILKSPTEGWKGSPNGLENRLPVCTAPLTESQSWGACPHRENAATTKQRHTHIKAGWLMHCCLFPEAKHGHKETHGNPYQNHQETIRNLMASPIGKPWGSQWQFKSQPPHQTSIKKPTAILLTTDGHPNESSAATTQNPTAISKEGKTIQIFNRNIRAHGIDSWCLPWCWKLNWTQGLN